MSKEFGIEFEKRDTDTVDGLAEMAFACARSPETIPHIVLQNDKGARLLETNSLEDVERFLQEG